MNIALVTPWFGKELAGGAERLAWDLAFGLRTRGHSTTVYSTCVESFASPWNKNTLKPGLSLVDELPVLRFPVGRVSSVSFRAVNRKLLAIERRSLKPGAPILDESETERFVRDNIGSSQLVAHLAERAKTYDAVLFLPYLYGTTLQAWRAVADRAAIVPCLHDEAYAYLEPVAEMMRGSAALFFNSSAEYELARRLYGPGIAPRSAVVGSGVALPGNGRLPRALAGKKFVLYIGRWDEGKNVTLLVDAFRRFRAIAPSSALHLVFAGAGSESQHFADENILGLGRVSDEERDGLLRSCSALLQPSVNESFSRSIMEAWACGRPVAVHSDCDVTAGVLAETAAGWQASDTAGWQGIYHEIDVAAPSELAALGARGETYVRENAAWERVFDRYEEHLSAMVARRDPSPPRGVRVTQLLERASYGDAETVFALQLDSLLRARGVQAEVLARAVAEEMRGVVRPAINGASGFRAVPTPSARHARAAAGVKPLDAAPFVDFERWNIAPDASLVAGLQDGRRNLLVVAPVAPQNRQLACVDLFARYLAFDPTARLSLVGPLLDGDYARSVQERIEALALEHRILMPGVVSQPALAAFYRTAQLFISLRESYPTGLSLLEAMAFDLPICALACEDARAVLGGSGILVTHLERPMEVAALWHLSIADTAFRATVLAGQRRRIAAISSERIAEEVVAAATGRKAPTHG
uniref:Glycosyl transferase family 1 domain-containing protein n=1 Tax=mine drainage metagenome TaxID=410659 RepID=E6Q5U7_9ZZZZ